MNDNKNMIAEDWKKEYEKIILTQKLDEVNKIIRATLTNTTRENIVYSASALLDYLASLPLGDNDDVVSKRKKIRDKVLEIYQTVTGDRRHPHTKELHKKYGLVVRMIRSTSPQGNPNVLTPIILNLPSLAITLNELSSETGDFAQSLGMRVTFSTKEKKGYEKALDEEGFEDLDIGIEGVKK